MEMKLTHTASVSQISLMNIFNKPKTEQCWNGFERLLEGEQLLACALQSFSESRSFQSKRLQARTQFIYSGW